MGHIITLYTSLHTPRGILITMNEDVLSALMERFQHFLDERTPPTEHSLTAYLTVFPSRYKLREVITPASLLFHRQWIRASIRGHRWRVRRACRALRRGDMDRTRHHLHIAHLWLGQAQKLFETVSFFTHFAVQNLNQYTLLPAQVQAGDIILSYKTRHYIKRSRLSWLVKLASNSPITHALVAHRDTHNMLSCVFSGDLARGLGTMEANPERGELFLIMRLRESLSTEVLNERIAYWHEEAVKRAKLPQNAQRTYHQFPEAKCQMASAVGLLTVPAGYAGLPLALKNPLARASGFFCSEFVDMVFKEAGYMLTPRSEHDAIVGPMEFLYSPLLELQGVIAHPEDLLSVQDEIRAQFIGS